jgi:hypothetical protein
MAARTTQPTADCTIFSAYDPQYVYVGSVDTPEFQVDAAVTYITAGGGTTTYNQVTRSSMLGHGMGQSAAGRVRIASASAPSSSNFIVLAVFYNETATADRIIASAKIDWSNAYGFEIASTADNNTLTIAGGSSTFANLTATGLGANSTLNILAVEFSGTTAIASMNGSTLGTVTGLTAPGAWSSGLAFGNYAGTGDGPTSASTFLLGAILGSKGSATLNQLTTNPWQIFDDGASASDATFAVTTASPTFSFVAVGAASDAKYTATTASPSFSLAAVGAVLGTITSPVLKNNTGTVLSSLSGVTVYVHNPTTGALVVKLTGQTTDGSGVLTCSSASIVPSTAYRVIVVLETGAEGMDTVTSL